MAYNVQQLENDLSSVLHGTTLDQVVSPLGLINRAARDLLLDLDAQETKRIQQLPIFNSVYDYPCFADLKGNAAIDIFPQVNRQWSDYWSQQFNQDFDLSKLTSLRDSFTVLFNTATKSLRINAPSLTAPTILNQASDTSNNGTWSVTGNASNLTANNTNFQSAGGALQFDLGSSPSNGGVVNNLSASTDISSMLNQGSLFVYVYLPTGSEFTSIDLSWGSDPTDYYSVTATTNQMNVAFNDGWNLIQFPWLGATVTGSPDPSQITYLEVLFNYTANQTGVLANNIFAGMPLLCNIEYYSKYLFRDNVTGTFQENATDPSNLINLDTDSYNLLFNRCGYLLAQQTQGADALLYDSNFFAQEYNSCLERYKALYKSEKQVPQATYYYMPNRGYNQVINSNTFWGN